MKYNNNTLLGFEQQGGQPVVITHLNSHYLDTFIHVNKKTDEYRISMGRDTIFQFLPNTSMSFNINNNNDNGLLFNPFRLRANERISLCEITKSQKIQSFSGKIVGYKYGDSLFGLSRYRGGYCNSKGQVYSIIGEFIGYFNHNAIVYKKDSYPTGEPIFIPKEAQKDGYFNLSHRLFPDYQDQKYILIVENMANNQGVILRSLNH